MDLPLKNFLILIGCLLVGAIILVVVSARLCSALTVSGKKLFGYGLLLVLFTAFISFGLSYAVGDPFTLFWLMGIGYLIAGIVHTRYVQSCYHSRVSVGDFQLLLITSVLGLALVAFSVILFSALQYFFLDASFLFYPVLFCTLLFFVPLFTWQSFLAAYVIPETAYPTWQYPLHDAPAYPEDISRDRILVIGLEMAKVPGDLRKTYFRAKVPETMKLCDFVFHFINDYNERHPNTPIAYMDADYEADGWIFHTGGNWRKGFGVLNPEFSIRENEVQENTVIFCERTAAVRTVFNTPKNTYHEG
jgi:hypothetical protein